MKNSFTLSSYSHMLRSGLENGYDFILFHEKSEMGRFCILRHDIDADLEAAVQVARVENGLGIRSTYFLMLRSPVYNLLSRANHCYVEELLDLGHHIGLHYDEGFYPKAYKDLDELILCEARVMELMFGNEIKVISFHQPGQTILQEGIQLDKFINTYDPEYFKNIKYISDSNMIWKKETPWEVFSKKVFEKFQLLIHPMWWVGDEQDTTVSLWNRAIEENSRRSLEQIVETERAFGEPRFLRFTK